MAGDTHQPMHVSRASDQGGNKISVIWITDTSNLHYATAIDRPVTGDAMLFEQKAPVEKWLN